MENFILGFQGDVCERVIIVRYNERVDFVRPVEALIPGAPGRVLAALARVETELPVSRLAAVSGVGRTRATAIVTTLAELGVVSRRYVGPTVLIRLERDNVVGELVARLGDLRSVVIERLRRLARDLDPQPLSLAVFGSFARGNADAASDIDMVAVRPPGADGDRWAACLTDFSSRAYVLTGNRVQVIDYELGDLRRRYTVRDGEAGAQFWRSVTADALVLTGVDLRELVAGDRATR